MRIILNVLFSIMVCVSPLAAQRGEMPSDTLAEWGTSVITARDFLERMELMPFPGKDRAAKQDSAKVRALRALVAEKLLAREAEVRGLNRDSAWVRRVRGLERQMVRDELFKREVSAKIAVTDKELSRGMRRYPVLLRLFYCSAESGPLARELRDSLAARGSFDSALQLLSPRLLRRGDTLTVTFGSQDRVLEDTAYTLTPQRRLSQAMKTNTFGWGVLYLVDQQSNFDAVNRSIPDRISAVQSKLRQRKLDERASRYSGDLLTPQVAEADSTLFEAIATLLYARIQADAKSRGSKKGGYRLVPSDLDSLEMAFHDRLPDELVHIRDRGMTLQEIIDAMRTDILSFPILEPELFRDRLNAIIKELVARDLLAREGYRKNLQHTDAVRHDVAVWEDYWSASALMKTIRDSTTVTKQDIIAFLVERGAELGKRYEVDVREVLCDSMTGALNVLHRALEGESLGLMARQISRRPGWSTRDGESGFFAVDVYPSLGFPALFQDSGTVGGPVVLKEGYSVFTTLGKRTSRPDGKLLLDSLLSSAAPAARAWKMQKAVDAEAGVLAARAGVQLHLDRLAGVKVLKSNMATRRLIGFGGVITAVPTILPLWDWKGEPQKRVIP